MTPCVITDGDVAYAMNIADKPVCVGCGRTPTQTGVSEPTDWKKQVKKYSLKKRTLTK
jgi:hypothetical protein